MAIFGNTTEETKKKPAAAAKSSKTAKKDDKKSESMKDLYQGKAVSKDAKAKKPGRAFRVLVKPLITEKASHLGAENKYVFNVEMAANKIEVAKAIEEVYGIKPVAVNIVRVLGKEKRTGRVMGKRKDWKKAIVTLPAGQSIKVYEGV